MQDLRTATWPVPYIGTLRPDSPGEDHGLGEPANRTVFLHSVQQWRNVSSHWQVITDSNAKNFDAAITRNRDKNNQRQWEQESRAAARKPRDAEAILFSLKFADDIHYKLTYS